MVRGVQARARHGVQDQPGADGVGALCRPSNEVVLRRGQRRRSDRRGGAGHARRRRRPRVGPHADVLQHGRCGGHVGLADGRRDEVGKAMQEPRDGC